MPAHAFVSLTTLAALAATPVTATAQGVVTLQLGGASSLPGTDVERDPALYGVGGLAFDWRGGRTAFTAGLHGGLAADPTTGADFVVATVGGGVWSGTGTAVGLVGRASGFRVDDPFTWRTIAARGGPAARFRSGRFTATLQTELGTGSNLVEVQRTRDRVRRAERDLWSRGADLEVSLGGERWIATLTGGGWSTSGGPFRTTHAGVTLAWGPLALRLDGGRWTTPRGSDWTGGMSVVIPLGRRASVVATGGRADPDPLTLVEAGTQGGALVGWTLASFADLPPALAEIRWANGTATARFHLEGADVGNAESVELLGDFNGWSPQPMHRSGDDWTAELHVPRGIHHYGFRVDGTWFVPEGRPGNVPDEWGRTNATLVVSDAPEGGLS